MIPIFGVTGWKDSGKTTMVERLVAELTRRGRRVSTVKHAHHAVDIDHPGRDSFRHREAGAIEVAVVAETRWALMHELRGEAEPPLGEILARLSPVDLVIVEGYKREPHPKLEVRRRAAANVALAPSNPTIIAIATDHEVEAADNPTGLPVFGLDDIPAIADLVQERYLTISESNR